MARFKGLTKAQQAVFEQIATGNDAGHHPRTLESLEAKGFIVASDQILGGQFPVKIARYSVPWDIHIRWCMWCSEQLDDNDAPGVPSGAVPSVAGAGPLFDDD